MHNTKDCCKYERDGLEKANFHATKKGEKKPNSVRYSFAQFWKSLKRQSRNKVPTQRNAIEAIAILTQNRESGQVA
jgi:hypothetical protein